MNERIRIIFLCTANSCRSQMAEGWARALRSDGIEAFSAGTKPSTVNPRAIRVMGEAGVDLSTHRSKGMEGLWGQPFDYAITLCGSANEECPFFLGAKRTVHVGFPDPAEATGTEEEILDEFRRVRDMIRDFVGGLPDNLGTEGSDGA